MNLKSKIQNLKSRRHPSSFILHPSSSRRPRRRGVVLLLVISLLALFILLGVTFTIVSLQALNASKLEAKVQATLDAPEVEMDLVLAQILYDTNARTVLQFHSLLRDLYGYDHGQVTFPSTTNPQPQFRESIQGNIVPPDVFPQGAVPPAVSTAGGQLYTFLFALQPFSFPVPVPPFPPVIQAVYPAPFPWQQCTVLSDIPNYYSGRVLTFTTGVAANRSARIVSYNPVVGFTRHQPNTNSLSFNTPSLGIIPQYIPAYGQITIEAIESPGGNVLSPGVSDSFIINGAPFNGSGAGYDPITRSLDAMLVHRTAIAQALTIPPKTLTSVPPSPLTVFGNVPLIESPALLPNFASYDSNSTAIVFKPTDFFNTSNTDDPQYVNSDLRFSNKARFPDTIALGGLDEAWDAPDLQNMFLAMVPPGAAQSFYGSPPILPPIIPSFHRPELVNFWVNFIRVHILEGQHGISRFPTPGPGYLAQLEIIAFPYGLDRIPGTTDDPAIGTPPLTQLSRDRIHNIMQGCLFRPMPWDHPTFTGSNSLLALTSVPQTPAWYTELETLFNNIINSPNPQLNPAPFPFVPPVDNRLIYDVDNDNDTIPDSIWIDPGLPIVTMPDGRRVKRLAAILIKDLDGSINLNAQGNLQLARNALFRAGDAAAVTNGLAAHIVGGLAPTTGADLPRGLGFGPAEVNFLNLFQTAPVNATTVTAAINENHQIILGRYVSTRQYVDGTKLIRDDFTLDPPDTSNANHYKGTNFAYAAPGLPYRRDALFAVKHNGIPSDYGVPGSNLPSFYASPPDVWGRGAVVLDWGGQPLFYNMGLTTNRTPSTTAAPNTYNPGEIIDSPYEMRLNGAEDGADSPYTVAELELLLRFHDPDASQLSKRLINYAPSLAAGALGGAPSPGVIDASHTRRNMVTTLSSSLPVPATAIPQEMRPALALDPTVWSTLLSAAGISANQLPFGPITPGKASILDIYAVRLQFALMSTGNYNTPATFANLRNDVARELRKIAPWEFFKGQKFDLNRVFGDGRDNNNNGVRDDILENQVALNPSSAYPAPFNPATSPATEYAWVPTDADRDDTRSDLPAAFYDRPPLYVNSSRTPLGNRADNAFARQLYARHLFCLAMLFLPDNYGPNMTAAPVSDLEMTAVNGRRWAIRRIAQWAVNCVDFRDQDSIMTPFEFDYNPWDGWEITTPYGDASDRDATDANGFPKGGLVWGMEAPDLLITETLAFHDRRVKDTALDDGDPMTGGRKTRNSPTAPQDATLDQYRVPQGSLFVELYCPRSPIWQLSSGDQLPNQKPQATNELYFSTPALPNPRLALDGVDRATETSPIWRLALTPLDSTGATALETAIRANPQTAMLDPADIRIRFPTGTPPTVPTPTILAPDRFIYFTNAAPPIDADHRNRSFCHTSNTGPFNTPIAYLSAGAYALIGPRFTTYLGSKDATGNVWGGPSDQKIDLSPVVVTDNTGTATSRSIGVDVAAPYAMVCDMPPRPGQLPNGWTDPTNPITWSVGMNVTEPLPYSTTGTYPNYYPEPPMAPENGPPAASLPPGIPRDFYGNPENTSAFNFKDVPVEQLPPDSPPGRRTPIGDQAMLETGTYANCSSVMLQRLADPTQPFHATLNPYITVDWSPIDVTVFNGEDNQLKGPGADGNPFDKDDTNPNGDSTSMPTPRTSPLSFFSRQRGYLQTNAPASGNINRNSLLWPTALVRNSTYHTRLASPFTPGGEFFSVDLSNPLTNGATYSADNDRHTLGSLNSTLDYPYNPGMTSDYRGEASTTPLPWLNWHNRPFSNAMELFNVPSSAPSRTYLETTPGFPSLGGTAPPAVFYSDTNPVTDTLLYHTPLFSFLPNFFKTSRTAAIPGSTPPDPEPEKSPHLYRLLDFVEVPSPFSGTERWYNPQPNHFQGPLPAPLDFTAPPDWYWAPFNKLSRFRDPGKFNINTIFDPAIWNAAVGQFPDIRHDYTPAGFFNQFLGRSRRGEPFDAPPPPPPTPPPPPKNWYDKNEFLPTRFANPFRPADSADLMPHVPDTIGTANFRMRLENPIDATLLRPAPDTSTDATPGLGNEPLFQTKWNGATENHRHTDRNAYFRYQAFQKLGNILTNNSNCFAVWITIGYFEVEENRPNMFAAVNPLTNPLTFDAAHPDGYSLGQEAGLDSGKVTRHRSFFIIDRSIPVGFSPGARLNTDECVLIRRLIE